MYRLNVIFTLGLLLMLMNSNGQVTPDSIPASPVDSAWEEVFCGPETYAQFPGGDEAMMKFLEKTMVYPKEAVSLKISGTVMVQFTVGKDGSIMDVQVMRGVHPLLDTEAVRAIKMMPRWIPGTVNYKPASMTFVIPIKFMPAPKKKSGIRKWLNYLFSREK
ncbi:MAG TPA: energy transducer TonB [Bacteroidales bacterium]|nr:energy transducer TonB [Bacteroidales bacterium]HRZ47800.1 energy transducer TonB [Bacteroidales bacterium]